MQLKLLESPIANCATWTGSTRARLASDEEDGRDPWRLRESAKLGSKRFEVIPDPNGYGESDQEFLNARNFNFEEELYEASRKNAKEISERKITEPTRSS